MTRAQDLTPDDIGRGIEAKGFVGDIRDTATVGGTLVGYSKRVAGGRVAIAIECGGVTTVSVPSGDSITLGRRS